MIHNYDWHHAGASLHAHVSHHSAIPGAIGHSIALFDGGAMFCLVAIWAAFAMIWWCMAGIATR